MSEVTGEENSELTKGQDIGEISSVSPTDFQRKMSAAPSDGGNEVTQGQDIQEVSVTDTLRKMSSEPGAEDSELTKVQEVEETSAPIISTDIQRKISSAPDVDSELSKVQEGGELGAPISTDIERKPSSPTVEDSELTKVQEVEGISATIIPTDIERKTSSAPGVEDSELTKEQEVGETSAAYGPTDIQKKMSSVPGEGDSEITKDQDVGEINDPLIPTHIQRKLSSMPGDEDSSLTKYQEVGEVGASLIPSDVQRKMSSTPRDEAIEVTKGQEVEETSAADIPTDIQRKISSVPGDEASELTKDQEAREISAPLIQSDSQLKISRVPGDEDSKLTKDLVEGEISAPFSPTDIQRKMSSAPGFEDLEHPIDDEMHYKLLKKGRIIDDKIRKPFIGGYILQPSGTEYHNASANTNFLPISQHNAIQCTARRRSPMALRQDFVGKLERSTQTLWSDCPKLIDTAITAATQTPVPGLHLIEPLHVYITPGELTEIQPIDDKVIIVQRWWRNCLKRKRILTYLEGVKRRAEAWKKELDKVQEERQRLKAKLQLTVDSLVTSEDFEHAYYALELERKRLIKAAQSSYTGHLLNLAYMYILFQEIKILQNMDKRKMLLREGKKVRQRHSILNQLSGPRTWISKRDGKPISMETSLEREFAQWKEIYDNLTMTGLSSDRRRELLNITYSMLEMHNDEDAHHIKDMITQELVLLVIGVDMEKLEPYHNILKHHLFDYLESYAFKKRPKLQEFKLSRLKNRLHICKECTKVKIENSFHVSTKAKELVKCKSCVWLENMSSNRKDYAFYRHILTSLRKEEGRLRCSSPVAFIIQVEDIFYLINTIWHTQSVLSQKRVLEDLRLCRFDNSKDWSPWNCMLLTHEEMLIHRLVTNPYAVYGECLLKIIQNKHQIASEYFKFLRDVSDRHSQTLEWINIKKDKPYKYYNVKFPKLSYPIKPSNVKLNPSKYERPGGKCNDEIQRL